MKFFRKMPNVELNEYLYQKKWNKNVGCRIKRERIFTAVSLLKQPQITFLPYDLLIRVLPYESGKCWNNWIWSTNHLRIPLCQFQWSFNFDSMLLLSQRAGMLVRYSKIGSPVMNTLWSTLVFDVELNECRIQKKRNLDVELSN